MAKEVLSCRALRETIRKRIVNNQRSAGAKFPFGMQVIFHLFNETIPKQ
ncbi:hypothetical protein BACCELL_04240 [Bacteroides cellulosilyticus DSM 14838]|uniref:Uncharacterized protein n=1 Tax=Bacteroides cellulosilyticus DSM 14838 TaxID=537012 RepID=E2NIV4_9BACE|nr:hypothetical protein BACCELL_04240 [Bacteroides cellulosilyticus DSM 14838]